MESSPFKVPIKLHHVYLCEIARDDANKLGPVRYPCSISVSHLSAFTTHWSEGFKVSSWLFFYPTAFREAAAAAAAVVEPLSNHPALLTNFSFDWTWAEKCIRKSYAGLRPPSSLIRDRVHKSLKHLCPPNKFTMEAEGAVVQEWGFEERMKQARLRLETLLGIFHHFLSVQGMKPKCCHLHIFLVESREKSEKHFGEHFKLGMCLFPGLACLALNEIQSLFRQQQIRHN